MHLTFNVKRTILQNIKSKVYYTFRRNQTTENCNLKPYRLPFSPQKTGKRDTMQTRIQELRKERRITQNELADAVNVTRQTIISLENGKYNASLVLAHKLAQFFNVAIEDIFIFDLEEENL